MTNSAPYSRLDRALHNLAFGSSVLQNLLEDIETSFFTKTWQNCSAKNPIFITSLPRSGTTIILEALHRLPGLATHTYRDMPFIFTPVLWNRISKNIRKKSVLRERAHGDGLVISEDSPEAFEEVLWRKYFPQYYTEDGISLWNSINPDFTKYFQEHMKKIVSLREPENPTCRYVSKNNFNIARVETIKEMFADSSIVIPLRNPVEHAISLWRQHNNFLEQHAKDSFIKKYMADIGHYEFGDLHRPIRFPGLASLISGLTPESLNYWIAYWIAAFEYLSAQDEVAFLSFEQLCQSPYKSLSTLCRHIGLEASTERLEAAASIIKKPPASRNVDHSTDEALTERAHTLHKDLLNRCLHNN